MMNLVRLSTVCIALMAAPLVTAAGVEASANAGMEKVEVKRLDEVLAKPNIDWAKYTSVSITPLDMSTTTIKAPSGTHKRDIPELTEKIQAPFKDLYLKAFTREFSEDGLLAEAGSKKSGTLRIDSKILELAPTYIPDSTMNASGRNRAYTQTAGKIQMQFDIYDAATGEHLATVTDKREATKMWRENNSVQNRSQINQIMGTWARIFRTHLDDLGEK
ncbi:DUF3313 family protein [Simiduia curdlanivorans]|uniref:DUF3313 family protein n=1 Tax=Simiduia curdlanivorans TaxID=1492769 RepID=A0ABV8V460_9GAMM|nr:DUF3313 family protein [Simiduia curdlanivorans]MDN3638154.1 DUF3313 family protein [Simiduia curdlanivorans]